MYKYFIKDEIVEEKLQDKYGKDYKLDILIRYQYEWSKIKFDIVFTKDNKALWIGKYKGDHYMNIIEEVTYDDDFTALDLYTTLAENAVNTIKHLREHAKQTQ